MESREIPRSTEGKIKAWPEFQGVRAATWAKPEGGGPEEGE